MATSGKRWSAARAACPRPEHAGSRLRFDGKYGKPGQRRQLYRCTPGNGDRPHRFTELLSREEAWQDACEACERTVHLHEGLRVDPDTGELRLTRHGQLVMDWVEVFAPIVFEPHRPSAWPAAGSLLLDDLPFSVRDPASGRFRIAFRVFCAVGFEHDQPKLWRIEAFPEATQVNWEAFLGALEGAPPRLVCDNHFGLNGAVRAAFRRQSSTSASGTCATHSSG